MYLIDLAGGRIFYKLKEFETGVKTSEQKLINL